MVRDQIGPVADFKTAVVVETAAQDPFRQDPARHDAEDRRWPGVPTPATIDDPAILEEIASALASIGYAKHA